MPKVAACLPKIFTLTKHTELKRAHRAEAHNADVVRVNHLNLCGFAERTGLFDEAVGIAPKQQ